MSTDLTHINAALTRTGSAPISSLSDAGTAAVVANANYDVIVDAEMSGYRWRWAEKSALLQELSAPPDLPFTDQYQLPTDLLNLRELYAQGPLAAGSDLPLTGGQRVKHYEKRGQVVLCTFKGEWWDSSYYPTWFALPASNVFYGSATITAPSTPSKLTALQTGMLVTAAYTWRVPEGSWPSYFSEAIRTRLEAIFLRGIGERYREADDRDKAADLKFAKARLMDSQSQPGRNPYDHPILRARRA